MDMASLERSVIDLRSQDLGISDLETFRTTSLGIKGSKDGPLQELIMFSSSNKPYNFSSLEEFRKSIGKVPDNASYFYYTLTFSDGDRCSLYLDPDRPGKIVMEGSRSWRNKGSEAMTNVFPKGGERYRIHQRYGILLIWGMVIFMAVVILSISYFLIDVDALILSVVIFTSSILGIYLSIVRSKELQPANTISFVKKRKYWLETLLHLITIGLGIVCSVMAAFFVSSFF